MDPITGAIAIAGLGMKLFGAGGALASGMSAADVASQESGVSQQITQLQQQENQQRQLAMQISARRQITQDTRTAQMTAAKGRAAAVNQGADQSSGAAGGQAQAGAQGRYNVQGTQQQLDIGNALFGIQGQITGKQIQMSQLQGQQSTDMGNAAMFGGFSQIGGSLAGAAGPAGNILGNFFGNSNDPSANAFKGYNQTGLPGN